MIQLIAQAIQTDCVATRLWAIGTLGRMGPLARAAAPALRAVLRDRDDRVHALVRWALDQLGEPRIPAGARPMGRARKAA